MRKNELEKLSWLSEWKQMILMDKNRLASWGVKRKKYINIYIFIYSYINIYIYIYTTPPPPGPTFSSCLIRPASFEPSWVLWIIPYIWANFRWGLTERPASRNKFDSTPDVFQSYLLRWFGVSMVCFLGVHSYRSRQLLWSGNVKKPWKRSRS